MAFRHFVLTTLGVVAGCAPIGSIPNITASCSLNGDGSSGSAQSCVSIMVTGNTSTATPTITATVPVQVGPSGLPSLPTGSLLPNATGAMVMAPPSAFSATATSRARHRAKPQSTPTLSIGPIKPTSDLANPEQVPWREFWRRTTMYIPALDRL